MSTQYSTKQKSANNSFMSNSNILRWNDLEESDEKKDCVPTASIFFKWKLYIYSNEVLGMCDKYPFIQLQ